MKTRFIILEAIAVIIGFALMVKGGGMKTEPETIIGAILGIGGMLAYFLDLNGAFGNKE